MGNSLQEKTAGYYACGLQSQTIRLNGNPRRETTKKDIDKVFILLGG
jgi:hypothetical protein